MMLKHEIAKTAEIRESTKDVVVAWQCSVSNSTMLVLAYIYVNNHLMDC